MKFINRSITHVGKVRTANEDNMGDAHTPNGHIFVVCDGMGGHVGGAQASSIAVNSIIEYFQKEVYDNVILALDRALNFANEQIYASALSNPELKGMGTTAVILLIREEECFIAHVGDSRIYLRSDGKLNRLTKDHSFVQTLVDSGVIDDEDAENHPNKNQILQALGIAPAVNGTISQAPILPKSGDLFLLCSDGLNGMVTDKDLESIILEENIEVSSENLIIAALNAGGNDNITASLILITESIHNSSKFSHFNPKPKVVDMTATQQFGGGAAQITPKKSKLPYYIGGAVVLLGACVAVMMLLGKEDVTNKSSELLTIEQLQNYVCQNVDDIKKDLKVSFESDTVINSQCEGVNHIFIVKDSVVIEVYSENITEKNDSDNQITVVNNEAPAPKKIKVMTKKEISSLKVGASVADENGEFEVHGFKIVVDKKKVKSKESLSKTEQNVLKVHTVIADESLNSIVKKYSVNCPNLSTDKLIEHNLVSPKFKGKKDKLEKEIIDLGWKLEIPCD